MDGGGVRCLDDVEADAREGHRQLLRRAARGGAVGFAREVQLEIAEREIGGAGHARDGGEAAREVVCPIFLQGGGEQVVVDHDVADGGDGDGQVWFRCDLIGCRLGRGGLIGGGLVGAAAAEDQHGGKHRDDEQDEEHKADLHALALALLEPAQAARLGQLLLLVEIGLGHGSLLIKCKFFVTKCGKL